MEWCDLVLFLHAKKKQMSPPWDPDFLKVISPFSYIPNYNTVNFTCPYCNEHLLYPTASINIMFTKTVEILTRSLANFYGQHGDCRHIKKWQQTIWQFVIKNKLMSVFHASVLLLTTNLSITLSLIIIIAVDLWLHSALALWIYSYWLWQCYDKIICRYQDRCMTNWRQFVKYISPIIWWLDRKTWARLTFVQSACKWMCNVSAYGWELFITVGENHYN